jgi:hypothetical protein
MIESVHADHQDSQQSNAQEGFKEQRRPSFDKQAKQAKKVAMPPTGEKDPQTLLQLKLPTRNFFAPLRASGMELDSNKDRTDGYHQQQLPSSQRCSPPPHHTSEIYPIQLQKQLKGLVKGSFEFRNTRKGTRVVTNRGVGYVDVVEALFPYRNATNIFLQISKKCFILQNIN